MDTVRINSRLSVYTDQPTLDDLSQIARAGFKTVVDLRTTTEGGLLLTPEAEEMAAQSEGLEYVHLPVNSDHLSTDVVDRFRDEIERRPGPILVHCSSGERSGTLAMLHVAAERDMHGDEVIEQAEDMGFECDSEKLVSFVKRYADDHARH